MVSESYENLVSDLGPEGDRAALGCLVAGVDELAGLPLQAEGGSRNGVGQNGPYLQSHGGVAAVDLVDGYRRARSERAAEACRSAMVVQLAFHEQIRLVVRVVAGPSASSPLVMSNIPHVSDRSRLSTRPFVSDSTTFHVGGDRFATFEKMKSDLSEVFWSQRNGRVAARFPIHRLVVGTLVGIVVLAGHMNIGTRGRVTSPKSVVSLAPMPVSSLSGASSTGSSPFSRPCTNAKSSVAGPTFTFRSALTAKLPSSGLLGSIRIVASTSS